MKLKKRAALLAGMAVLTVAATFYRLEHWVAHEESALIILLTFASMPISAVLALRQIVEGIRTKRWLWQSAYGAHWPTSAFPSAWNATAA